MWRRGQLIWLGMSWSLMAMNYRVTSDQCVAPAVLPAVEDLARQLTQAQALDLRQLGAQLRQQLVSIQQLQLQQLDRQTIAIHLQSVQPLYLLLLTDMMPLYVLAQTTEQKLTIVPARLINPRCLEQLPTAQVQVSARLASQVQTMNKNRLAARVATYTITPAEAKLLASLPAELPTFLASLPAWVQQHCLVVWRARNRIELQYQAGAVPVTVLTRVGVELTDEFMQACLKLAHLDPNDVVAHQLFFSPASGVTTDKFWTSTMANGALSTPPATPCAKARTKPLAPVQQLLIDLRFHKQVIISNVKGARDGRTD